MIEALVGVPVIPEPGKVDGRPETPEANDGGLRIATMTKRWHR
jgi:hypothetical protein